MSENIISDEQVTESDRLIHTPSSFARNNLTYAQETGKLKSLKHHVCTRENLESYLIFMVLEGSGLICTGGKDYPAKKGDIVFLNCRSLYSHVSSEKDPWTIRWVHFNGSKPASLYPLFEEANGKSPVFTPARGLGEYEDILDRLAEKLAGSKVVDEMAQSLVIDELMSKCVAEVAGTRLLSVDEDGSLDSDDYATLRESVNEHIGEEDLLHVLSIQYGIQPENLSDLFSNKYGISLLDYILNRKLNKAKELLRFTIKSLDEIVKESGIEDIETLRKLFMDNEEMSPEDYRKRWAQWIKS